MHTHACIHTNTNFLIVVLWRENSSGPQISGEVLLASPEKGQLTLLTSSCTPGDAGHTVQVKILKNDLFKIVTSPKTETWNAKDSPCSLGSFLGGGGLGHMNKAGKTSSGTKVDHSPGHSHFSQTSHEDFCLGLPDSIPVSISLRIVDYYSQIWDVCQHKITVSMPVIAYFILKTPGLCGT